MTTASTSIVQTLTCVQRTTDETYPAHCHLWIHWFRPVRLHRQPSHSSGSPWTPDRCHHLVISGLGSFKLPYRDDHAVAPGWRVRYLRRQIRRQEFRHGSRLERECGLYPHMPVRMLTSEPVLDHSVGLGMLRTHRHQRHCRVLEAVKPRHLDLGLFGPFGSAQPLVRSMVR